MTRVAEAFVPGIFIAVLWTFFVIRAWLRRIERKVERVNAIEGLLINWKREWERHERESETMQQAKR